MTADTAGDLTDAAYNFHQKHSWRNLVVLFDAADRHGETVDRELAEFRDALRYALQPWTVDR